MTSSAPDPENYVETHLPLAIIKRLESGAFQSLCEHLRERSDEVPNIDLMTVSGFCRNCLSKWLVVEARKLSDSIQKKSGSEGERLENAAEIVEALDALGYDEAAQYVYGMMYPAWKKRHAQKASDAQMQAFQESKPLWATHNKEVLAKRREEAPSRPVTTATAAVSEGTTTSPACPAPTTKASLLSNVCCEDIDAMDTTQGKSSSSNTVQVSQPATPKNTTTGFAFVPPDLPAISFSLGVLTVSDRAVSGEYPTGDLSGPAVTETVRSILADSPSNTTTARVETAMVPDEKETIQKQLLDWSSSSSEEQQPLDLVLTTGGTGFAPRDVTPESTQEILERTCDGLLSFCGLALRSVQPLAALSRGTAGVRGSTMVVNLPGNPAAVGEILPILLPLVLQAVADMKK